MEHNKIQKYDLIFSLGGNCSASHNLRFRSLRKYALPFDWTLMFDEKPILSLIEGFKNNFKDFLKYENLIELTEEEESKIIHPDTFHYKDKKTGFYYVNHFRNNIRTTNEYDKVKKVFDKRILRLLDLIQKSNRILMILSTDFFVNQNTIELLYNSLKEKYPTKEIDIRCVCFSCLKDEQIVMPNIVIDRYTRKINVYDVLQTNFEWAFLDDIRLTKKIRNKIKFKLFGYRLQLSWSK